MSDRARVRQALIESHIVNDALGYRRLAGEGYNGPCAAFMGIFIMVFFFVVLYGTVDEGPGAGVLLAAVGMLIWKLAHGTAITVSHSTAFIGAGNRGAKIHSAAHEMRAESKAAAVDRILEAATDPYNVMMRRLEDPEYIRTLVEAQQKHEKV